MAATTYSAPRQLCMPLSMSFRLRKAARVDDPVEKLAATADLHDQVDVPHGILSNRSRDRSPQVLEGLVELDDVGMILY